MAVPPSATRATGIEPSTTSIRAPWFLVLEVKEKFPQPQGIDQKQPKLWPPFGGARVNSRPTALYWNPLSATSSAQAAMGRA